MLGSFHKKLWYVLFAMLVILAGCQLGPGASQGAGWTSYTNPNQVESLVFDTSGDLWTVGHGGVVHWDMDTGAF